MSVPINPFVTYMVMKQIHDSHKKCDNNVTSKRKNTITTKKIDEVDFIFGIFLFSIIAVLCFFLIFISVEHLMN